ncbi:MAG: glycosyltransferase family 2 protein [Nitrososphaerota archaeon]|nr:glycosyltransferase family 2 protein [Nitrososphaerota archaeon]
MSHEGIVVLIPAHNEEKSIAKVIIGAKKVSQAVIVCDDGSTDMTGEISRALGAQVLRHDANEGKGKALASLFEAARTLRPRAVVTIDGDDQHDPADIPKVVEPVLRGDADIVVGVRQMDSGSMPRERVIGNKMLDSLTSARAGEALHDTQSGFRAYGPSALEKIGFSEHGMATESQTLIDAVGAGLRIEEVPVSVRYRGIPQKRNPLAHLSHVIDYLITRTIVESPLLYLGLPGLVAVVLGIVAGLRVLSIFSATHQIAVGTALVGVILVLVGIVALATSLILKMLTARFQGAR